MEERGLFLPGEAVICGSVTYESGYEAIRTALRKEMRFTAVFAFSDDLAVGAMAALFDAGLRVPEDVSVIGFDDVEYAKMCYPGLTTIRQNIMEKGRQSARLMIEAVQDHSLPRAERIIPMELIERGTVKRVDGN